MEQMFQCASCGEENELYIDQVDGDRQRLILPCQNCSSVNIIVAKFNYYTSEFDLEVSLES